MPTITVCKGCKQKMQAVDEKGNPACVTCIGLEPNSGVPVEARMPDNLHCSYRCGTTARWDESKQQWYVILSKAGGWNAIEGSTGYVAVDALPFMDARHGTFYCGCYGWD